MTRRAAAELDASYSQEISILETESMHGYDGADPMGTKIEAVIKILG